LAATQFALGNPFKARALEMIGFKAALGSWALIRESVFWGAWQALDFADARAAISVRAGARLLYD
jgi:hypothetical protein